MDECAAGRGPPLQDGQTGLQRPASAF